MHVSLSFFHTLCNEFVRTLCSYDNHYYLSIACVTLSYIAINIPHPIKLLFLPSFLTSFHFLFYALFVFFTPSLIHCLLLILLSFPPLFSFSLLLLFTLGCSIRPDLENSCTKSARPYVRLNAGHSLYSCC